MLRAPPGSPRPRGGGSTSSTPTSTSTDAAARPRRPGRSDQADQPGRRLPAARPHGRVARGLRHRRHAARRAAARPVQRRGDVGDRARPHRRGRRPPGRPTIPIPPATSVGWIAAGLVAADATDRKGTPNRSETESALSAMLRAIDTTLWTVDPFGSLGTEHIAGLVGRPIAVVRRAAVARRPVRPRRPRLRRRRAAVRPRSAAYDALAAQLFQVRLGEITRTDDGLLGYFVDDDYSQLPRRRPGDRGTGPAQRPRPRRARPGEQPTRQPVRSTHTYIDTTGVLHDPSRADRSG